MKKLLGLCLFVLLAGCTLFDPPEGTAELSRSSVSTRIERPTTTEEIVYCNADVKVTNTSDKTIYKCTITAVAKSDKGIDHYVSLSYDVNIPPSQSVYITLEWSLVRQIDTANVTTTHSETHGTSNGSSLSSSSQSTTDSTGTTVPVVTVNPNGETAWDVNSVELIDCFFS